MPKYILDPCVEDELWDIWHFIAQDDPEAATGVIEAAYESFKTIAANPGIGKLRRFRNPRLRDVRFWRIRGFENYLIFYRGVAGGHSSYPRLSWCEGRSKLAGWRCARRKPRTNPDFKWRMADCKLESGLGFVDFVTFCEKVHVYGVRPDELTFPSPPASQALRRAFSPLLRREARGGINADFKLQMGDGEMENGTAGEGRLSKGAHDSDRAIFRSRVPNARTESGAGGALLQGVSISNRREFWMGAAAGSHTSAWAPEALVVSFTVAAPDHDWPPYLVAMSAQDGVFPNRST